MENLQLPNEIVLQILGYLSLGELIQCARVSKRFSIICKDRSLSYSSSMSVIKDLTVKERKSIIDTLIARPDVKEVKISLINWEEYHQRRIYASDFWNSLGLFRKALVKISLWKRANIIGVSVKNKSLDLHGEAGLLQVMNFRLTRFLCLTFGLKQTITYTNPQGRPVRPRSHLNFQIP